MLTPVLFIVSLFLLLRHFKSSLSRMIIGLLFGSFAAVFICVVLNAGKYTLQPGQSVELKVFSKTEQLEYNSELILEKKDDAKVKLSGRKGWEIQGKTSYQRLER